MLGIFADYFDFFFRNFLEFFKEIPSELKIFDRVEWCCGLNKQKYRPRLFSFSWTKLLKFAGMMRKIRYKSLFFWKLFPTLINWSKILTFLNSLENLVFYAFLMVWRDFIFKKIWTKIFDFVNQYSPLCRKKNLEAPNFSGSAVFPPTIQFDFVILSKCVRYSKWAILICLFGVEFVHL